MSSYYSTYRWCAVPECKNTNKKTPDKLWIQVPFDINMRKTWFKVAGRDPELLSVKTRLYLCEDHFDLEHDMENYIQYKIMGSVKRIRMNPHCIPSRFDCNRKHKSVSIEAKRCEKNQQFDLRRPGISAIPENSIEITTCFVADDIDCAAEDINCAAEVEVCRVCLALDVKMHNLRDTELQIMFENITGIAVDENNHAILDNVCWECAARLKAAATFRNKALLSDTLLQDLINTGEQIRKSDITTIKENEGSLTTTLTAIEAFHIDIEDQNITQPLQSAEDSDQTWLSEHDYTENIIIKEIKQENTAMDFEEDEIDVPIKIEIEDDPIYSYLGEKIKEENIQDSTCSIENTMISAYSSSLLDTGIPLLETSIEIKEENPVDCMSSKEDTITVAHSSTFLDMGLSSLSQENCEDQINETGIKTLKQ